MMKIQILDKINAGKISKQLADEGNTDTLFISINQFTHCDRQYNDPSPIAQKFIDSNYALCLWFDDVTPETDTYNEFKYKLFSKEDAQSIINFLNNNIKKDIKQIIVHCTAGISRSGAIGSALNDYYNKFLEDNSEDHEWMYIYGRGNKITPNPHVSKIMRQELGMQHI